MASKKIEFKNQMHIKFDFILKKGSDPKFEHVYDAEVIYPDGSSSIQQYSFGLCRIGATITFSTIDDKIKVTQLLINKDDLEKIPFIDFDYIEKNPKPSIEEWIISFCEFFANNPKHALYSYLRNPITRALSEGSIFMEQLKSLSN